MSEKQKVITVNKFRLSLRIFLRKKAPIKLCEQVSSSIMKYAPLDEVRRHVRVS